MVNQTAAMLQALGLPGIIAEPEVVRADLASIQAKSLARIIAALINENEPLLKAEQDGTVIAVDERGGPGGFVVTVTPAVPARDEGLFPQRDSGAANNRPESDR